MDGCSGQLCGNRNLYSCVHVIQRQLRKSGACSLRGCLRSPQVVNDELKMGKGKVHPQLLQLLQAAVLAVLGSAVG